MNQVSPVTGKNTLLLVTLGLILILAAELSRQLSVDQEHMSAIWPPLGIAIGAALVLHFRAIIVYALALLIWLLWHEHSIAIISLVIIEQSLQCLIVAWLIKRFVKKPPLLDNIRDTLRFYLFGVVIALMPVTFITVWLLYSYGLFAEYSLLDVWLVYWLSEALGVLLFAPLAEQLTWSASRGARIPQPDKRSLSFIIVMALLITLIGGAFFSGHHDYGKALTYLYFPLLAWAAMSGQRWLAIVAVPLSAILVMTFVVYSIQALQQPAGFLLVEAVLVIFMMVLMTQLAQAVNNERARLSRQFKQHSLQDMHTGLLNDRGILNAFAEHQKWGTDAYMGVLIVQGFDDAQDLLEPDFSRRLEQHVGKVISLSMGKQQVARLSSGYFAFFFDQDQLAGNDESCENLCEKLCENLCEQLNGYQYTECDSVYVLRISIGIIKTTHQDSTQSLLSSASLVARYAAQMTDKPYHLCNMNDDIIQQRTGKLTQLEEIKWALNENRFLLYAQEIRPVEPDYPDTGYEVLIRMQDRQGNIVPPGLFLPVANDYGLMGQIDRWVVQQVFQWCAQHHPGPCVNKVSINLSGATLGDPGFLQWLENLLQQTPVDTSLIAFEVTESESILDWQVADRLLKQLRGLGFSISLDDFGTGLATFDYLTRFPFDVLKIDGRFIREICTDAISQSIVASITRVAHSMKLKTVAEFVEDEATQTLVASLGVDFVQGYGISKPFPIEQIQTPTTTA